MLDKIAQTAHTHGLYLERYLLEHYENMTKQKIDLVLSVEIPPSDYSIFTRVILKGVKENGGLDATSRTLLRRLPLSKLMEADYKLYKILMDLLLKSPTAILKPDRRLVLSLHNEAVKLYKSRNPGGHIVRSSTIANLTHSVKTLKKKNSHTELKLVPSKHHIFECYDIFEDLTLEKFLGIIALSSEVKSLFMLLEALDMIGNWEKYSKVLQDRVVEIREMRGWSRVPTRYVDWRYSSFISLFSEQIRDKILNKTAYFKINTCELETQFNVLYLG